MSFRTKMVLVTLPVAFAAFAVLWGRGVAAGASPEAAGTIGTGHLWLIGIVLGYAVSQVVSWRFAGSFSVSATRMLVWSIFAYLAVSRSIDIIGNNWGRVGELIGGGAGPDGAHIEGLRALLATWIAVLWLSLTSILVGFEGASDRDQ